MQPGISFHVSNAFVPSQALIGLHVIIGGTRVANDLLEFLLIHQGSHVRHSPGHEKRGKENRHRFGETLVCPLKGSIAFNWRDLLCPLTGLERP